MGATNSREGRQARGSGTEDPIPKWHSTLNLAEIAVILLAQGSLQQYARILTGREIVRQNDGLPRELQDAMCKLGRLYIEQGSPDRAACVHDLLDRARWPFDSEQWGLAAFGHPEFPFSKVVLIDPDLRVPTSDCAEIAAVAGAFGEENLIEHRLHQRLRDIIDRLGPNRQHLAYTAVRELFARRSLISETEFLEWLARHSLTPVQEILVTEFFDRVPDLYLIDGKANRCAFCGTLLRPHANRERFPDGRCPVRQCSVRSSPRVAERLDPAERLLVARPPILTYWTGPSLDELSIFDEARLLGLDAELYPESDLCDVSIGGRAVGIDAKSYASPVTLALRLNRGIGGLINYRRRIITVGDELIAAVPGYISTLLSVLEKHGDPSTLEIKPVSVFLNELRGIGRAHET